MNPLVRAVVGVARFLYRFVVGDDLTVAVVMLLGLAATALLAVNGINPWWLVPVLAVLMTGISLRRRAPAPVRIRRDRS
jgi:hypothetical protein